jgi:hypothetical protein
MWACDGAVVGMTFFRVFRRAAETASWGSCTRPGVVPFPAAVTLDDCDFPGEKAGIGDSTEKTEPGWEGDLCVFREVDKPA